MMTTNLFVIANVKQLRTYVVLEFYCLFFRISLCVGVTNTAIINSFHNRVEFSTILEFRGGGRLEPPKPPPRYASHPFVAHIHTLICIFLNFISYSPRTLPSAILHVTTHLVHLRHFRSLNFCCVLYCHRS